MKAISLKLAFACNLKLLVLLIFLSSISKAQTLPVAAFTYSVGTNGVVNFTSTSTNTIASLLPKWFFGDGTTLTGPYTTTHTYTANGTYAVILAFVSSQGVIYDSTTKAVPINNVITGVVEQSSFHQLNGLVYCNPDNSTLILRTENMEHVISAVVLVDVSGKEFYPQFIQNNDRVEIASTGISAGIYTLRAGIKNSNLYYKKQVVITNSNAN